MRLQPLKVSLFFLRSFSFYSKWLITIFCILICRPLNCGLWTKEYFQYSLGESIHRNYDLLLRHRLHIVGEIELVVNHYLLGLTRVRKEELTHVLSDPQVKFEVYYVLIEENYSS